MYRVVTIVDTISIQLFCDNFKLIYAFEDSIFAKREAIE